MRPKSKGLFSILLIITFFTYGFVAVGFTDVSSPQRENYSSKMLIPGGNVIGVKFYIDGVHVLNCEGVQTPLGKKNPAKDAGLKSGDYITAVNSVPIYTNEDLSNSIQFSQSSELTVVRNGYEFKTKITPVVEENGSRRIGIWVRDSTAGIGTVTFYDPETHVFGALGHAINDQDTKKVLSMKSASVYNAKVTTIRKGTKGEAGELGGVFLGNDRYLGELIKNSSSGIFGTYNKSKVNHSPVPIASSNEITEGKATIYCSIQNEDVKEYEIEISKIIKSSLYTSKGMIIKITDPKLLEKTNGIVQGMSGSPILQNGRIVGAVTHVFVNDPTRGYGIFIENMLAEAEKIK
ncbi:MAG: SpoIVB peptidase [Clostridia bacterium]|nr:SpoIVB peptidase [Clostridia bacterium]